MPLFHSLTEGSQSQAVIQSPLKPTKAGIFACKSSIKCTHLFAIIEWNLAVNSMSMGSLQASSMAVPAVVSLPRMAPGIGRKESLTVPHAGENGGLTTQKKGPLIADIPLEYIRRPLLRTRNNDPEKVKQLMESIAEIGLQEPIDVLEVEGAYYGFSGCHRYEAHQKLGLPTIKCKIRRGTRETLRHESLGSIICIDEPFNLSLQAPPSVTSSSRYSRGGWIS